MDTLEKADFQVNMGSPDANGSSAQESASQTTIQRHDVSQNGQDELIVQAALAQSPAPQNTTLSSTVWRHLTADIKPAFFAEFELIILTICTGMQDAVTFPDYHCFASNQTGNTVFLVLALVIPELNGTMFFTANIGTALGFFLAGGWITGQLSHLVGPRCRLWLMGCNLLQACLVFAAAATQHTHGVSEKGTHALEVIGMLAFAAGSQVVQSRSLSMTEISTAMATAAWVDLLIDPNLMTLKNRPRTRRVVFLVSLVVGTFLGAGIYRTVGSSAAMLCSASGKAAVAFLYLFNAAEKPKAETEKV